jgi:23S rRNA (cytosine1962-C5)-methyltransferase
MEPRNDVSVKRITYLIQQAIDKRSLLFKDPDTDCFRIFNSYGDGIDGLTADYYSGYILIQFFNESAKNGLNTFYKELTRHLPLKIEAVLCKNRLAPRRNVNNGPQRDGITLEGLYPAGGIIVKQNGIKANVDLLSGQNTGIFLDMREVRKNLEDFYKTGAIKKMLNLFSYTALFSVHALKHGISNAINIDLSKSVLQRAKKNYEFNNLAVDERDFIYGDALSWVKQLVKKGKLYDYIIFDPPTFARNKQRSFSVKKDFSDALQKIELLVEHGLILTSVNSFSVSRDEYISYHPREWELVMFANESSDFVYRDYPYLKTGLWKI